MLLNQGLATKKYAVSMRTFKLRQITRLHLLKAFEGEKAPVVTVERSLASTKIESSTNGVALPDDTHQ